MYQRENNGRGCKVKTSQANNALKEINSISQPHGEDCAECLSSGTRCVLNVKALGKLLTTSSQSKAVVIRWRGTTCKRCVIVVTMLNRDVNRMKDDRTHTQNLTKKVGFCLNISKKHTDRGGQKLKTESFRHHRPHKANTTAFLSDKKSRCGQNDIVKG